MIRIFRSYNPALLLVLLAFIVLLWLPWLIHPAALPGTALSSDFIFYRWIYDGILFFFGSGSRAAVILSCLLLFGECIYFNYIININHILSRPSYLPAFCFALLGSSFQQFIPLNAPMFANLFLLMSLSRMLNTHKRDRAFSQIFDASLYAAVASLLYFPCVTFLPFVILCVIFIRPFHLRELLISLVGFVLPFYFLGVYYYWNDQLSSFIDVLKVPGLNFQTRYIELNTRIICMLVPVTVATVWSIFFVQRSFFKMVVQVRQSLLVFVLFFGAGIFSLFIQFHGELTHFCWAIVPLSLSLALFCLEWKRTVFSELLILFLILSILFFNFNFF